MQQNDKDTLPKQKLIDLASDNEMIYESASNWFIKQGPEITDVLIEGLENDMLGSICHWRILLLLRYFAKIETLPAILKQLRLALQEKNSTVLSGAMEALAVFHSPEAINALIALLQEPDQEIIQHAAVLLGQTRESSATEPLIGLLKNDNLNIRYSAVKGLLLMDTAPIHTALKQHMQSENDTEIRELFLVKEVKRGRALN
ncbi:MAG: hypothetical protein BA867_07760 [Desulfobacterales bacterium S5133MH16]|nr:MAG: hypothetical protein BA867_07760 [Desulfobacterales bacterium S5133MH16]